jgi:anthranilate synthase component I
MHSYDMFAASSYELVKQARPGSLVPVIKKFPLKIHPVDFFAKLSDYGRKPNSILLESADIVPKYGEHSIGSAFPCLRLTGFKEDFKLQALTPNGLKFIKRLKAKLKFCEGLKVKKAEITGSLKAKTRDQDETARLKTISHADIIRETAFCFHPTIKPFTPYAGLFGTISYDFIDYFEALPPNRVDLLAEPYYDLYFLDNLFMMDHKHKEMSIIACALIDEEEPQESYQNCLKLIHKYEEALETPLPAPAAAGKSLSKVEHDTSAEEYQNTVNKFKEHIIKGDIFQVVYSQTSSVAYQSEPLDIYRELRTFNPSPYMFYFNFGQRILIGASPEKCLSVFSTGKPDEYKVEIRPIAGTKPRGLKEGKLDLELDSRYETALKVDAKELAEHTMLIDLARNDVARVSTAGTRIVDEPFVVEKYSHVQHLVSNVSGILQPGLDCLHAYLATMNMGTLTGAPKIMAMSLIRKYEKTRRGCYGGSVLYITPSGELDSTIIIRSMLLQDGMAYIRSGAGIVYDSVPETEWEEVNKKAGACLKALENCAKGKAYDR